MTTETIRASSVPAWRVAIDFGTTHTSIAVVAGSADSEASDNLESIGGFPGDRALDRIDMQVPTEIAYLSKENDNAVSLGTNRRVLYGYLVKCALKLPEGDIDRTGFHPEHHVRKMKLLLDPNAYTAGLRETLQRALSDLKQRKIIKKSEDVITDLLTCFLQHTKHMLQLNKGLSEDDTVELSFTVPVCWTARANSVMSGCLQRAMRQAHFGVDGQGTCDIFMVNEAEAAATHAISCLHHELRRGETFILLDCGGGTTEAGLYTIAHEEPLRLESEVNHPTGEVCGSDDLNEAMRKLAMEHLRWETYLEDHETNTTIASAVESDIMDPFETWVKRDFSLTNTKTRFRFPMKGLRGSNDNPRICLGEFILSHADMKSLFLPSLDTIEKLMKDQIYYAIANNIYIDKVILTGGFGDSPALKEYLKESLQKIYKRENERIRLLCTPKSRSAAGVAKGALMRAMNKDHGPKRVPIQSIGILHHVSDDPSKYPPEVLRQKGWEENELTGESYIMNTIQWLIKVNQKEEFKPVHTIDWLAMHPFNAEWPTWIAQHKLFVSDECTEDFYTRHHTHNRGKTTELGVVEFDLTYLKDDIRRLSPDDFDNTEDNYIEVNILIRLKIIDRNLEFSAYWPADDLENANVVRGSHKFMNVVSAFRPGTE